MVLAEAVEAERSLPRRRVALVTANPRGLVLVDVQVVATLGLGRGRDDRLGQTVGLAQTCR